MPGCPDLTRDSCCWIHAYNFRHIIVPGQCRILPPTPGQVLVEIVIGTIVGRRAQIRVTPRSLCKSLGQALLKRVRDDIGIGTWISLHDGHRLSDKPFRVDDVVPCYNWTDPGMACKVLLAFS